MTSVRVGNNSWSIKKYPNFYSSSFQIQLKILAKMNKKIKMKDLKEYQRINVFVIFERVCYAEVL